MALTTVSDSDISGVLQFCTDVSEQITASIVMV
jgi:hypothetical protein